MSPFRSWFGRVEKKSAPEVSGLSNPETFLFDLFGSTPLASGVSVNPTTAMQCAPVAAAVHCIAQGVSRCPFHVYQRSDDGSRERAPDHPLSTILRDAANEWTPSAAFVELITADALLHRNGGIAEIIRVEGRPVELIRLDPQTVTIETDPYGAPLYKLSGPRQRVLSYGDVLHLAAPKGAPAWLGREAIGLALVLEQHGARLFGNGARPSGILSIDGTANDGALAKIKTAWNAAHGGQRSGGTAVLPAKVEYSQLSLDPVSSQYLELRRFAINEIARFFGVPPTKLAELERGTFANTEQMGREFVDYTLAPWLRRWEGEIRLKLLSADERETFYVEALTDALVAADLETRAEAYSKLIAARILNPNEARALENRAPYPGGDVFANPNTSSEPAPSNV